MILKNPTFRWTVTFLWAVVILVLSTTGGVSLPESWMDFFSWDKVGHFGVYAILTWLWLWALSLNSTVDFRQLLVIGGLAAIYGVAMELIQYSFFPNRFFEVLDIIANIIGCLLGAYIFNFNHRRKLRAT